MAILDLLHGDTLELLLVTPRNHLVTGGNREFEVLGTF